MSGVAVGASVDMFDVPATPSFEACRPYFARTAIFSPVSACRLITIGTRPAETSGVIGAVKRSDWVRTEIASERLANAFRTSVSSRPPTRSTITAQRSNLRVERASMFSNGAGEGAVSSAPAAIAFMNF